MLRAPGPLGPPPGRLLLPDAAAAALRLLPLPGMEPVPKAVLGAALAKPRRPVIACSVCQIRFNSESQAAAHYQGNRHARRLKGLEAARARRGGDPGDTQDPPARRPPRLGRRPTTQVISPRHPQPPAPPGPPRPLFPPGCGCGGAGGSTGGAGGKRKRRRRRRPSGCCTVPSARWLLTPSRSWRRTTKGRSTRRWWRRAAGWGPSAPSRGWGGCGDPPGRGPRALLPLPDLQRPPQLRAPAQAAHLQPAAPGRGGWKTQPAAEPPQEAPDPPELAPLPFPKELPKALAGGLLPPPGPGRRRRRHGRPRWPCAPGPPSCPGPPGTRPAAPCPRAPAPRPRPLLFSPY
ncbi:unnamed protein product [Bubo scandiacus]